MAREDPQLKLRLTEELKERVTTAAREGNRSVNAEIVDRLEKSFRKLPDVSVAPIGEKSEVFFSKYYESVLEQIGSLKKLQVLAEHTLLTMAHAIREAAAGNPAPLNSLIEREKDQPLLRKISSGETTEE